MILDTLQNTSVYEGLHPNLDLGLKYIKETNFLDMEMGKHEIKGDEVFAIVQTYDTKPEIECSYEAHKKYTDIQFMVKGKELMGVVPFDNQPITKDLPDNDVTFYDAKGQNVLVAENSFAIFFINDVHMPGIMVNTAEKIIKVVVKVAMD